MRRLLGLLLLAAGVTLLLRGHIPALASLPSTPAAAFALLLAGLVLALFPGGRQGASADPLRADVARRGFILSDEARGWRAEGAWQGRAIAIRRVSGYEASRFGLDTVVEVIVAGHAAEPWPLPPDLGRLVERREAGCTVAIPALSRPGQEDRLARLVDGVLAHIAPPPA
jgi:hypothetical protein